MTLKDLLERAAIVRAPHEGQGPEAVLNRPVTGVAYDSRQVTPGSVFVALRGVNTDGAQFASQAVAAGAIAIVSESKPVSTVSVPWFQVANDRGALAELAATFYEHPSTELMLVGITGTNGKTTTSYILTSIFEAAGVSCGRIGTVGYRINER